jgi:hypothetical protein
LTEDFDSVTADAHSGIIVVAEDVVMANNRMWQGTCLGGVRRGSRRRNQGAKTTHIRKEFPILQRFIALALLLTALTLPALAASARDEDIADQAMYGSNVNRKQILDGAVPVAPAAQLLLSDIGQYARAAAQAARAR